MLIMLSWLVIIVFVVSMLCICGVRESVLTLAMLLIGVLVLLSFGYLFVYYQG